MKNNIIYRGFDTFKIQENENKVPYLEGYALKFNQYSRDLGGFVEKIDPKALKSSDYSDVVAAFNHDSNLVLARYFANEVSTLELKVDETGLLFRFDIPNLTYAKDLAENIRLNNIKHCSFAFTIVPNSDTWERIDNQLVRTITKIEKLVDVSIVTNPAYYNTNIDVRSIDSYKEFEKIDEINKNYINNLNDYIINLHSLNN